MNIYMENMAIALTNKALTATEVVANLAKLDNWHLSGDGADVVIEKTIRFNNYAQTMTFVNAVAWLAQARNHHPEWRNVWNTVEIWLWTHDAGGITRADVELAVEIGTLAGSRSA